MVGDKNELLICKLVNFVWKCTHTYLHRGRVVGSQDHMDAKLETSQHVSIITKTVTLLMHVNRKITFTDSDRS